MKVEINVAEPDFTLNVLQHIENRYKNWADYAAYHAQRSKVKIDIHRLIEEVKDKLIFLKQKKLAQLFYAPGFGVYSQLDIWVLNQIKKRIAS